MWKSWSKLEDRRCGDGRRGRWLELSSSLALRLKGLKSVFELELESGDDGFEGLGLDLIRVDLGVEMVEVEIRRRGCSCELEALLNGAGF